MIINCKKINCAELKRRLTELEAQNNSNSTPDWGALLKEIIKIKEKIKRCCPEGDKHEHKHTPN